MIVLDVKFIAWLSFTSDAMESETTSLDWAYFIYWKQVSLLGLTGSIYGSNSFLYFLEVISYLPLPKLLLQFRRNCLLFLLTFAFNVELLSCKILGNCHQQSSLMFMEFNNTNLMYVGMECLFCTFEMTSFCLCTLVIYCFYLLLYCFIYNC